MIIACVKVGTKYGPEYVYKLQSMVQQYLSLPHSFVCLTDHPHSISKVQSVGVGGYYWPGWWSKMCLFEPSWRGNERVLYFDLDTLAIGPLDPLGNLECSFGICENFARLAGLNWPCKYGSCVMTIGPEYGSEIWSAWKWDCERMMKNFARYGDQKVIEQVEPKATLLQSVLPEGFFVNKRELTEEMPKASVVVFGGNSRPSNSEISWVKAEWARH